MFVMLAKKSEAAMQLKDMRFMKSKATVELPKQDREQQVQESKRKKASGLTMFHLNGYVKVSSATLAQPSA